MAGSTAVPIGSSVAMAGSTAAPVGSYVAMPIAGSTAAPAGSFAVPGSPVATSTYGGHAPAPAQYMYAQPVATPQVYAAPHGHPFHAQYQPVRHQPVSYSYQTEAESASAYRSGVIPSTSSMIAVPEGYPGYSGSIAIEPGRKTKISKKKKKKNGCC